MYLRHRRRRSLYGFEEKSGVPQSLKTLIALGVLLLLIYWIVKGLFGLLGIGTTIARDPVMLYTDDRGLVTVSLQGEDHQTAENGMNMFPGDSISTATNARGALHFFDGTWARFDGATEAMLGESSRSDGESTISVELKKGKLWVRTPAASAFTGTIIRRVVTPSMALDLPPKTEALLSPTSLIVFAAGREGIAVSLPKRDSFFIGEGQKWTAPAGVLGDDVFAYRSALETKDREETFVTECRSWLAQYIPGSGTGTNRTPAEPIALTFPPANHVLREATVTVQGTVGTSVKSLLINGQKTMITEKRTFSQEVAPPEGQKQFDLQLKALDAAGTTLGSVTRSITVEKIPDALAGPEVTSPAKTNEMYRTNAQELVLRGTSPEGATGIMVNSYKLQLFSPEKGTWSYLASQSLGNLQPGENIFDVYALDAAGRKSEPARITIVLGGGEDGVIGNTASSAAATASAKPVIDPATLPTNAPLAAGTLSVTGPTPGTTHTETGTGFLLEGKTSNQTASLWVNDYQLQLYKPGQTFWNYIASVEYANLKKGENIYKIVARNEKGEIVDMIEYTVTYEPR